MVGGNSTPCGGSLGLASTNNQEATKDHFRHDHFELGEGLLLTVGAFLLTVKLLTYSPLRPFLDALSHCKQKNSNCK